MSPGRMPGAGHGIAGHLQQERGVAVLDQEIVEGQGVDQLFFGGARKSGLNRAEDPERGGKGTGDQPALFVPAQDLELFEPAHELGHGVLRPEARHLADLGKARHPAIFLIEPRDVPDRGTAVCHPRVLVPWFLL